MSKMTIYELKENVRQEVQDRFQEIKESRYESDLIHELVDSHCPIYYKDILDCAIDDFSLATEKPEVYAFNGEETAINAIAGNIYQVLVQVAYEEYELAKGEAEDEK